VVYKEQPAEVLLQEIERAQHWRLALSEDRRASRTASRQ
jgi:hypothetical protein